MKSLRFFLPVAFSLCVLSAFAGPKKHRAEVDTRTWRYDIEYADAAPNGTLVVKVWSFSRRPKVAMEQCRKNAVHGVVFKSYTSSSGRVSQSALVKDPKAEETHADFFRNFFADGGPYMKYVQVSDEIHREIRKINGGYKVGVVVTVSKDQLRKALEADGIIHGLNHGF